MLIICCGATHAGSSKTVHRGALVPRHPHGSLVEETQETGYELKRAVWRGGLTGLGVGIILCIYLSLGLPWQVHRRHPIISTVYPEEHAPWVGRVDAECASYVREQAQMKQDNARATRRIPVPVGPVARWSVTPRYTATSPRPQRQTTWPISPRTSRRPW
jgi:hypothetical protein